MLILSFKYTNIKIQRIQNGPLYRQYAAHKDRMNKRLNNCNEKFLYHGSAETAIDNICKLGFNRSYCGVNGIDF